MDKKITTRLTKKLLNKYSKLKYSPADRFISLANSINSKPVKTVEDAGDDLMLHKIPAIENFISKRSNINSLKLISYIDSSIIMLRNSNIPDKDKIADIICSRFLTANKNKKDESEYLKGKKMSSKEYYRLFRKGIEFIDDVLYILIPNYLNVAREDYKASVEQREYYKEYRKNKKKNAEA